MRASDAWTAQPPAFKRLLPDLHEESYIHIDDVRPTTYGYGGRTQEFRYHHPPA